MAGTVFWDVDTQYDFMLPGGKLYIRGAEGILYKLRALTEHARRRGIPILGSTDWHEEGDAEITGTPDLKDTYPSHCLGGSAGAEKVWATNPSNPLWINSTPVGEAKLRPVLKKHKGEIYFRKARFDVFSNPNVETVLGILSPARIVVYGVALDVCVSRAVDGFLKRKLGDVVVVEDAVQALRPAEGARLLASWKRRGVTLTTTGDLVEGARKKRTPKAAGKKAKA